MREKWALVFLLTAPVLIPKTSKAYAVLSHMAIVDECWKNGIQPLLLKKFPALTVEQLKDANAYAYGGAIMPDMGYYPFGAVFFTNLVHYVRTGDFVENMLSEAKDEKEYAFALGSLCHYFADTYGHSIGVNLAVPLVYSKMKEKFGDTVNYAQNKISHTRLEFGFDVLQIAQGNYAPTDYHRFIGFKVSENVLKRAFRKTYGIDIKDVFKSLPLAIATFRFTVKNFFPVITKIAWANKKSAIDKANPAATEKNFTYRMTNTEYHEWQGKKDNKPGLFPETFSWVIKLLPKFGPLRAFKFKVPTPQAEQLFMKSFKLVVKNYSGALKKLPESHLNLVDKDFDTGKKTEPGEYKLADKSYNKLLMKLQGEKYKYLTLAVKTDVLNYYAKVDKVISKESQQKQRKIKEAIGQLQSVNTYAITKK